MKKIICTLIYNINDSCILYTGTNKLKLINHNIIFCEKLWLTHKLNIKIIFYNTIIIINIFNFVYYWYVSLGVWNSYVVLFKILCEPKVVGIMLQSNSNI